MSAPLPAPILDCLRRAHPSWHACLHAGLQAMMRADPSYLPALAQSDYLPNKGRLLAAFAQPLDAVRYVLVGEGPYPRAESATGVCFMDGAVEVLWSEKGLSKRVNRATSLRNFMKMLLVADGLLAASQTSGDAMAGIAEKAQAADARMIQTLADLQDNLHRQGFLLLNATLVYREDVPPKKDASAWEPFLRVVLNGLCEEAQRQSKQAPTLVLWGKIAERLAGIPEFEHLPQAMAEHPYNLSFIVNPAMQKLFGPMRLLNKTM